MAQLYFFLFSSSLNLTVILYFKNPCKVQIIKNLLVHAVSIHANVKYLLPHSNYLYRSVVKKRCCKGYGIIGRASVYIS